MIERHTSDTALVSIGWLDDSWKPKKMCKSEPSKKKIGYETPAQETVVERLANAPLLAPRPQAHLRHPVPVATVKLPGLLRLFECDREI